MKKSITKLLKEAALAKDTDQLIDQGMENMATNGPLLEISKSANADIERMVAGMILLPEVCAILLGEFIQRTTDSSRSYKAKIEEAKRRGTMPHVEILVYGNEAVN